jgi:hypothetical protein
VPFVVLELTVVNINNNGVREILIFVLNIWKILFYYFLRETINNLESHPMLAAVNFIFMHIERTGAFFPSSNIDIPIEVINDRFKKDKFLRRRLKHSSKNGILIPFDCNNLRANPHLIKDFLDKQVKLSDLSSWGYFSVVKYTRWK